MTEERDSEVGKHQERFGANVLASKVQRYTSSMVDFGDLVMCGG